jgi:hypothetical protein
MMQFGSDSNMSLFRALVLLVQCDHIYLVVEAVKGSFSIKSQSKPSTFVGISGCKQAQKPTFHPRVVALVVVRTVVAYSAVP